MIYTKKQLEAITAMLKELPYGAVIHTIFIKL